MYRMWLPKFGWLNFLINWDLEDLHSLDKFLIIKKKIKGQKKKKKKNNCIFSLLFLFEL